MTLQQLEYIVALDNHRHFSRAADSCFITQPTLTMQVKKLEDEIGIQIFDRERKPLKPTPAGEQVILKARQITREVQQMKELVADEKESLTGEFALGIIPTIAPYLVPKFLPGFIRENRNTILNIREIQTSQIISDLIRGTIDIGILAGPLNEKSIREVELYEEPFLVYLPADHALTGAENISMDSLDRDQMLLLEEGHCFRDQMLAICQSVQDNRDIGFDYKSGSIEGLKGLVDKGLGFTLVPELSVTNHQNRTNIRRFNPPEPARAVIIAVHNSFTKEALIDRLHDSILTSLPDHFLKTERFMRVKWR